MLSCSKNSEKWSKKYKNSKKINVKFSHFIRFTTKIYKNIDMIRARKFVLLKMTKYAFMFQKQRKMV